MEGMSQPNAQDVEERTALSLLRDVTALLATAVQSLDGRAISGKAQYVAWCARTTWIQADAFLCLRDAGKKEASKQLIRLPLELSFKLMAVLKKPGMLFRLCYTEYQREKKFYDPPLDAAAEVKMVADMESAFKGAFPAEPRDRKQVRINQLAEAGNLKDRFHGDYAIFCNQNHGALRTMMGQPDGATDRHGARILALCVLTMLDQLKTYTPANVPDIQPLVEHAKLPQSADA